MAEEVKIIDVAGGPAAEATLQDLLKAVKKISDRTGSGAGSADRIQDQYDEALRNGTIIVRRNSDQVNKNTSAFKKLGSAIKLLWTGISAFSNVIGSGVGVAANFIKAFADGTGTLTDMVSQLPIFGSLIGAITGLFDDTLRVFQQLTTSGASFNNNLTELRVAAAGAKVSLETFSSFIAQNTEKLAAFGGTVTQGAQAFGAARKAMGAYEQDLLGMGLTFEEINEGLADYMYINRAGSRSQQQDMGKLAQRSADYTKNLMTLSKITGEDIKSQREKVAAQQADVAFQMKLAKIRPEERAKIQSGLAEAMAAGGETGAAFFKQQFLGMPPLTRQTQLFAATMPQAAAAIQKMSSQALDTGTSMETYQKGQVNRLADFVEGAAAAGEDLESLLAATSGGLEGPGSDIAQIMQGMGKQFSEYIDTNGRFNREKLIQDIEAAQKENGARDDLVTGLTGFQNTLRDIKKAIELHVIGPIGKAIGPQLVRLSNIFKSVNESDLSDAIETIGDILTQFADNIQTFGFTDALKRLMTDIGDAAKPVFMSMIDSIKTMWSGQSVEDVKAGMQTSIDAISKQKNTLMDQLDEVTLKIIRGGMTEKELDAADAQAEEYRAQLGRMEKQQQSVNAEMETATETTGLFGSMLSGVWDTIKGMDWKTIALGIGGMTVAIVALGYAAKPVVGPLLAIGAAAAGIGLAGVGLSKFIDSITGSISRLADGLGKMQDLDPAKLLDVGTNLAPLTANLVKLGVGGIVASFIGEGTFERLAAGLQSLSEVNSAGVLDVSSAIAQLSIPILKLAGVGLVLEFVNGNTFGNLAVQLKQFEALDVKSMHAVGPAMQSLHQGIQAFTGDGLLDSIGSAVGGFFNNILGNNDFDDLVKNLKKFESVDAEKIYQVGQGLQGIANFATGDVSVGDIKIGTKDLEKLNSVVGTLDSGPIIEYNKSLEELIKTLRQLGQELTKLGDLPSTGTGTGTGPGTVPAAAGGSQSQQNVSKLDELNSTMTSILVELQHNTEYSRRTSRTLRSTGNLQM